MCQNCSFFYIRKYNQISKKNYFNTKNRNSFVSVQNLESIAGLWAVIVSRCFMWDCALLGLSYTISAPQKWQWKYSHPTSQVSFPSSHSGIPAFSLEFRTLCASSSQLAAARNTELRQRDSQYGYIIDCTFLLCFCFSNAGPKKK